MLPVYMAPDFAYNGVHQRTIAGEHTMNDDLTKAHQWASHLMEDETQDRTMILEGLLEMILDVTEGTPVDVEKYNRYYTRRR